ncbi:hypothetical protein [Vulcanisaeta distributa]|uniref:Uncharacterized protein n=1 Tax=Vulcanisaeta distributa (strain DSM 14429 / JCM 11212 / NBRC 100878 / IC-017) TaxID=572478 RepID=E1QSR9_VULDI|nr:hypothetical protein [Vulcanisaeta distributa]ADN49586.1 conserved hypothetical protein [Vulcanisaeta distributa DSM 14429]
MSIEVAVGEVDEGVVNVIYRLRGGEQVGVSGLPTSQGVLEYGFKVHVAKPDLGLPKEPRLEITPLDSTTPSITPIGLRPGNPVEALFIIPSGLLMSVNINYETPQLPQSSLLSPIPSLPAVNVEFVKEATVELVGLEDLLPKIRPVLSPQLGAVDVSFIEVGRVGLNLDPSTSILPSGRPSMLNPVEVSFQQAMASMDISTTVPLTESQRQVNTTTLTEEEIKTAQAVEEVYSAEEHPILGLGNVTPEKPVIILAHRPKEEKANYIEFLKRFLREVYRVRVGGLPAPKHVSNPLDLRLLLPIEVGAGGRLFILDLTSELGSHPKFDTDLNRLRDRLRELFSQGFGFIVLYGDEDSLRSIRGSLWREFNIWRPVDVSIMGEDVGLLKLLTHLMWGDVEGSVRDEAGAGLDVVTVYLEDEFWRRLGEVARDFNVLVKVRPSSSPDEGGRESMTHYLTKAFVVRHLIDELKREFMESGLGEDDAFKKALDCVETEYQYPLEKENIRLDIYVKQNCGSRLSGLAVEVETLYGTGTVVHKLLETVESRVGAGVKGLWVVVPNPQAVIYLPLLLRLRNHVRSKYGDIELYTLDIHNGKLVKLTEVAKKILNTVKEVSEKQKQQT